MEPNKNEISIPQKLTDNCSKKKVETRRAASLHVSTKYYDTILYCFTNF